MHKKWYYKEYFSAPTLNLIALQYFNHVYKYVVQMIEEQVLNQHWSKLTQHSLTLDMDYLSTGI